MGALAVRRDGTEAPAHRPVLIVRIDAADADADGRRATTSGGFQGIVHDLLAKANCRTRAHAVTLAARQGVI
jgi:hypothetical protein